jgi:hypothetical protein
MFPPVPAPFAGSLPQDGLAAATRLPAMLDRAFSALAVLCAAAAAAGLALGGAHIAWPDAVKLISAALLLPALFGMWQLEQIQEAPSLAVTRIYSLVQHRLRSPGGPVAVTRHPHEDAYGGLAGLIAGSVTHLRRLQAGRASAQEAGVAVDQALRTSREQAGALAEILRKDASAMADAASGIMAASARLAQDTLATRAGSDAAQQSVDQVITRATSLADAVCAMTVQINTMTKSATTAAQCAFGAHAGVAALVERTSTLSATAEAVCRAIADAQADPAHAADFADTIGLAVAGMQATVAGLRSELAIAVRHVVELSDVIQNQQDAGIALSHAVDQQGDEIRHVLILLQDAHAGMDRMRDAVDGVTRHGADRQAEAEAIRGAANRLPAHADVIAGILRNIPDFTPLLET